MKRGILHSAAIFGIGAAFILVVQQSWTLIRPCHRQYDLLNPAMRCGRSSTEQGEWDYEPLRNLLIAKKEELKTAGTVSHISIYFRDLDHGPRFGIGEYDQFQPASLLKLPVMIAFLHEADINPAILDQTLSFTGSLNILQNLKDEGTEETIQPDTPYTIRELLRKMIVYSDNNSSVLLVHELNNSTQLTAYHAFHDLDVLAMMLAPKADYISIQAYANLFAVLFNTGYLSRDMSQFALQLLSEATFREGLAAGVPDGTKVAHKFGHRVLSPGDSQLHDCGIVYHPSMSYVLCVMTSGSDLGMEESAIAGVSKIVYDTISSLQLSR